jgi:hypothetical protein
VGTKPSWLRCLSNKVRPRGLVKMSATWWPVGMWVTFRSLVSTLSRM